MINRITLLLFIGLAWGQIFNDYKYVQVKVGLPIHYLIDSQNNFGIDKLLTHLSTYISKNVNKQGLIDHVFITHRQRALLESSLSAIDVLIKQIDSGLETDLLASGLRGFVAILRDVVGGVHNEDVLNNIFSNFCVGK